VVAAAARGERASVFCFEESPTNLMLRAEGLGLPLREYVNAGTVRLQPVDPAEFSPGELSHEVRRDVEAGARIVVIDSINGYMAAMPEEHFLTAHVHELASFLSEKGVATLFTVAQQGLLEAGGGPVNISYVADTVILFRFFETRGEVKKAISVMKKRSGRHEHTIRELRFGPGGIEVSAPITDFQGVLTGNPVYVGDELPRKRRRAPA
jgi:circadian clock protein KaiC